MGNGNAGEGGSNVYEGQEDGSGGKELVCSRRIQLIEFSLLETQAMGF